MKLLRFIVSKSHLFSVKRFVSCESRVSQSVMDSARGSLLLRIPELSNANVIIPNPELVIDKLGKMSEQSNQTLQVVTDFDATLTKPTINGKPALGSLEVFAVMDTVPEEFVTKCKAKATGFFMGLRNPKLSLDEKMEMSVELLTSVMEILKSLPIPDDSPFVNEAAKGLFVLREGTTEAFKMLKDCSVPVLVLSGGLTCIINYVLKEQGLLDSNVHVLATSYKYKDGHIESFDGDIVHFFNKNICYLKSEIYKKELSKKHNVIVMGDALADSTMVDGVPETFNVLKIGFCHKNLFGQGPEEYAKNFDIVITEDETMTLVNAILKYVLSPS